MTEPAAPEPLRRPRRRWGCLIGCVALAIPLAILAYAWLLAFSFQECNPPRTIQKAAQPVTAAIDVDHPVVEQSVHVDLKPTAIPPSARPGATRVQVRAVDPTRVFPRPSASLRPGGPLPAARVTFLDGATGHVLANDLGGDATDLSLDPRAPVELTLDCAAAEACSADLRVVIALSDPGSVPEPMTIAWETSVEVDFGFVDCKGPPYDAATITAEDPIQLGPHDLAAAEELTTHFAGTVVAQHVTVTSAAAPEAGWLRTTVSRPTTTWLPWLAVLPDDGGPAVFDRIIGAAFQGRSTSLDLPVLTSCETGPCRSGYWVIVRGIPLSGPYDTTWAPVEGFGQTDLRLLGLALARPGGAGPPVGIRVEVDSSPIELASQVQAVTGKLTTPLTENQPLAFDVTLHLEPAQATSDRPDPFRSTLVVVRVNAVASAIGARLEGDGVSTLGAAVGGFSSLAAVPFASCRPGAACDAHLRIVMQYAPSGGSRIIQPTPGIDAQVYVLGALTGVTASVSGPVEAPSESLAGGWPVRLSWPLVVAAILVAIGLAIAVTIGRRRGRRSRGTHR